MTKLPQYFIARKMNKVPPLPMNYTFSILDRCNSRCKTCNIWRKPDRAELTYKEWVRVFQGLGHSPYWVTLSGGEPFLREDLVWLYSELCRICRPAIVNIPTNGLLTDRIVERVGQMAYASKDVKLVVNISVDHMDAEKNDGIRGIPGDLRKALRTRRELVSLGLPNLTVGVHTVISSLNVDDFPEICDTLMALSPHQYITEIAELRAELKNTSSLITPELCAYSRAIKHLTQRMRKGSWKGLSRLTRAFRLQYYHNVLKGLTLAKQPIPCYAGVASVQIMSDGIVWACCIEGRSLGNLRNVGFDLKKLWGRQRVQDVRRSIKRGDCHCPLANVSYTNMLLHPQSIARVLWRLVLP